MRLRTSWFNGALFKKNCTRFWPIWAGYALLWIFLMPMQLLSQLRQEDTISSYFADVSVLRYFGAIVPAVLIAAILAAMAVFSYLYNSRSTGMLHTLPVRREELFLTNYLSGLAFLAGPVALVFFLTLGAEAIAGYVNAGALCMWLVIHLLVIFFFYSFAVFCAMFTGNIVALPVFYGILNGLATVLYFVVHGLLQQFLYGYDSIDWLEKAATWLTPAAQYWGDFFVNITYADDNITVLSAQFVGLGTALIYAGVGLLLAVAALLIYRRRALETAGDVVSVPWVRPIFKYGVGACAALVGGMVLYSWFGYNLMGESIWGVLVWLLPCGAVGYFGAQMLLDKSFRVFSKWKGCLILLAGLGLSMGLIYLDPIGFGRWVPDPQQLVGVTINTSAAPYDEGRWDSTYTAPQELALAAKLQQAIIGQRGQVAELRKLEQEQLRQGSYQSNGFLTSSVNLSYELADGRTIHRHFDYLVNEALLGDPSSPAAQLTTLLNLPGQEKRYEFPVSDKVKLVDISFPVFDQATGEEISISVPKEGLEEVYAAVRSDLAAGRLGIRYLIDTEERMNNCYYNDLTLAFYSPEGATALYPDVPVAELKQTGRWRQKETSVQVTLQATATDTLAALHRLGLLDDEHTLTTYGDYQLWQQSENAKYSD